MAMIEYLPAYSYYLFAGGLIYLTYLGRRSNRHAENHAILDESIESGMSTPPSLHPIIDHNRCIGCEACVHACPEFPAHTVLGLIRRKATLVSPTDCIGHGACKAACPVGAISLVHGTAERGIDIPDVSAEFQTSVPGISIAGELGGMGLIRNAVTQGSQAMEHLRKQLHPVAGALDVVIVGAGPAGFAATLAAHEAGLKYVTLEQQSLGGTVAQFPRRKIVMTAPVDLPMYGQMRFREAEKEDIISFWENVEARTGVSINYGETVNRIDVLNPGFLIATAAQTYRASSVLLALGRRGTPRKLGVPGEDLQKVIYNVIDPAEHTGKHVCVVGGGDSALEAAHSIAQQKGTEVTLSYRSAAFTRAKRRNRDKISTLATEGRIRVMMNSELLGIASDHIVIKDKETERPLKLPNDLVVVCAGGILPTAFLKETGICVETHYGAA